jgi:hypothetical protein
MLTNYNWHVSRSWEKCHTEGRMNMGSIYGGGSLMYTEEEKVHYEVFICCINKPLISDVKCSNSALDSLVGNCILHSMLF